MVPDYASRAVEKIAARASLPPMPVYGLRHLNAAHLRESGVDGIVIAKRLVTRRST